ncbi:MAG: glycoside hydrolase family 20 zincin-like fold domain-containing protein [Dactylosporangium sp.]|nr:glycoside hydrolase family 20 zincin-like fold domain-containing protein [Dactylosporangium sp.]
MRARLRVTPATRLPGEGYVLAIGQADGRQHVAVDGVDGAGTYCAVQTVRQLAGTGARLPGAAVRAWPAMRYRGTRPGATRNIPNGLHWRNPVDRAAVRCGAVAARALHPASHGLLVKCSVGRSAG